MATCNLTVTPGVKGGAPQTNIGIRHAPASYLGEVEAWLAANKAEAMEANGEFEVRRDRVSGVVITVHRNKKNKVSVSMQGETVKLTAFPLPENLYAESDAERKAVELACGQISVDLAGVEFTELQPA